jgi:glycosidase
VESHIKETTPKVGAKVMLRKFFSTFRSQSGMYMKKRTFLALPAMAALLLALACNPPQTENSPASTPNVDSSMVPTTKPIVYQLMVRHFGNTNTTRKNWGTLEENGVGKFSGVNDAALDALTDLGITHVWYTGVLEHATATAFPNAGLEADDADVVKGRLGSPYAIKDYYDVAPALADDPTKRVAEFEALVARTHAHGLKAIIDFVPNHVARAYHSDAKPAGVRDLGEGDDTQTAFAANNNFYYLPGKTFVVPKYDPLGKEKAPGEDAKFTENPAKATGNNVFSEKPSVDDWFETVKLNYGIDMQAPDQPKHFEPIPSTWTKMTDILLYWAGKGVDGFRCDMAEMVPVEFWAYGIQRVKEKYPKVIFIAEIYNPAMYHDYVATGGFDYLYDKVGVYDKIRPLMEGKLDAKSAGITEVLAQSEGIDGNMLRFLENHDEQRIASQGFAGDAWAAVPGMTVTALLGTGPVLIYAGQESGEKGEGVEGFAGEDGRTTIFDYWGVPAHQAWFNGGKCDGAGLDSSQKALRDFYRQLLHIAKSDPSIVEGERFLIAQPDSAVYAFLRCIKGQGVLVVANFSKDRTVDASIMLPTEAWKAMLGNAEPSLLASDLLHMDTGGLPKLDTAPMTAQKALSIQLPPNSARIIALGGDI